MSGPFQNRAESQVYIQGLGTSADYWVRTAGSLRGSCKTGSKQVSGELFRQDGKSKGERAVVQEKDESKLNRKSLMALSR